MSHPPLPANFPADLPVDRPGLPLEALPLRLPPGADLRQSLQRLARDRPIAAGCVLAATGSLARAVLRFAGQSEGRVLDGGPFEIVALSGTMAAGGLHLHAAIADGSGHTWGGHLLDGCRVYTTAELVVGILPGATFAREPDPQTGYLELVPKWD